MNAKDSKIVFEEKGWQVELRTRTNHNGYKVWGIYNGYEIFSYDERGLRPRSYNGIVIPAKVISEAMKSWEEIQLAKPKSAGLRVSIPYASVL